MANITREDAAERSRLIANASYDVQLDFTGQDTFRSHTVIRFAACPARRVSSTWWRRDVRGAVLNGFVLAAPFRDRLALPFLSAENELIVDAEHEYSTSGVGIHRFVDPENDEVFLYSQFATMYACHAFACFDQPDIKGTFRFTVTAPAHWVVVSNTKAPTPRAATPDGPLTWAFEPTVPLPTYATAVCAGPYAFVEGSLQSVKGDDPRARLRPAAAHRALRR